MSSAYPPRRESPLKLLDFSLINSAYLRLMRRQLPIGRFRAYSESAPARRWFAAGQDVIRTPLEGV
jgi:hypothetical protein